MGIIDQIKDALSIREVLNYYGLEPNSNGKIACCVNNEKTPSLHIRDDNSFCCYSCGTQGDVLDFIQHQEQCGLGTAIKIASSIAGISDKVLTSEELAEIERRKQERAKAEAEAESRLASVVRANRIKATEYCKKCAEHLKDTDYFTRRGLTRETQAMFNLGYEPKNNSVIIPYNRAMSYFITRKTEVKEFWKPRCTFRRTQTGDIDYVNTSWILGKEPVWNAGVLCYPGIVIVCESPIDAMSLMQYGVPACAIGGTNGESKLEALAPKIKATLLFGLDTDDPGRTHAKALAEKFKTGTYHPDEKFKDWNEWLQQDPKGFAYTMRCVAKGFDACKPWLAERAAEKCGK